MTAAPDVLDEYIARYSNWGRWGADDQIGTANHLTAAHVRRAAGLIRTGGVISLAMNFDQRGPQTGANGRFNCLRYSVATGSDHVVGAQQWAGKPLPRKMGYADDTVVLHLQSATHWDSLAHIFHDGHAYNGIPATQVSSLGAPRLGSEKLKDTLVGRAVLLDIPRAKSRNWLEDGDAITVDDLEEAAEHEARRGPRRRHPARGAPARWHAAGSRGGGPTPVATLPGSASSRSRGWRRSGWRRWRRIRGGWRSGRRAARQLSPAIPHPGAGVYNGDCCLARCSISRGSRPRAPTTVCTRCSWSCAAASVYWDGGARHRVRSRFADGVGCAAARRRSTMDAKGWWPRHDNGVRGHPVRGRRRGRRRRDDCAAQALQRVPGTNHRGHDRRASGRRRGRIGRSE